MWVLVLTIFVLNSENYSCSLPLLVAVQACLLHPPHSLLDPGMLLQRQSLQM